MTDETEWGPWIEHDGRGFPEYLRGRVIEIEAEQSNGEVMRQIGITTSSMVVCHWDWSNFGTPSTVWGWWWARVLRYRIRKPRGLTILEELIADLPEEVLA